MKLISKVILVIVLTVLISVNISAIGVSPGRTIINFEPASSHAIDFTIYNNDGEAREVTLNVEGDLAQYIELETNSISFSQGETIKKSKYFVRLPLAIREPGEHKTRVIVKEARSKGEGATSINVLLAVVTELVVNVPFAGKAIDARFYAVPTRTPIEFYIPIRNIGSVDLDSVKANIEITDENGNELDEVQTKEIPLLSNQEGEILGEWYESPKSGVYNVRALVNYDGDVEEIIEQVEIGNLLVEVLEINVDEFSLGEVAKFDVLVENKWNADLDDVYAEMRVVDERGNLIVKTQSSSVNVPALSQNVLSLYWNTENVREGNYETSIILRYAGNQNEKKIDTQIRVDGIVLEVEETSGFSFSVGDQRVDQNDSAFLVIILVIILNIIWFRYFKKKVKK